MRPRQLKSAARHLLSTQPYEHDGIGIDLRYGAGRGCYTKVPGGAIVRGGLADFFTFTGGNQSYYRGPSGLLIPSVTNTPRVEYDTSGNALGLLMETARTNSALWSRDFTNAAWVKVDITAAKDQTGVDGVANSASSLTADASGGTVLQTIVLAAVVRTLSFYMKRITGTGPVSISQDGVTFTDISGDLDALSPEYPWVRVSLTATQLNPIIGIEMSGSGDVIAVDFATIEAGAAASSCIPTTTVGVTRTADRCVRTLGTEFSATAGTLAIAGTSSQAQDAANSQFLYEISDGTANERYVAFRVAATDTCRFNVIDGGAGQGPINATLVSGAKFKMASAWAANDLATSFNGGAAGTDASATLPTVTTLDLGSTLGLLQMNGHILRFDYWPVRQPNAFLLSR